jgi:aminopeptidase N
VPGTNLTRDEAAARSALLTVESYHVELDLTGPGPRFDTTTTVRFRAADAGESFADLVVDEVTDVVLNGQKLDPATVWVDGRIRLPDLAADNELRVVAAAAYGTTGRGLYRCVDPADGQTYVYTQFELADARRVFATFEQPDLKASFTFTVTAPQHWTVLSNSPSPQPAPGPRADTAVWRFDPTPPLPTYLAAVAGGPLHLVRGTYQPRCGPVVPLAVACRASLSEHLEAAEILAIVRGGMDHFIELLGQPYPFAKLDHVFVPELAGAMENAGLVTLDEQFLFRGPVTADVRQDRAGVLLHELAHMWFGDLVTMRWWDDLWLKEAFATYLSLRCQAATTNWADAAVTFAVNGKAWGLGQDALPTTHPVVADITDLDDVHLNYDGITYAKGAAVIGQLVAWVGEDAFVAAVRDFFHRYAWRNATLADLLAVLEHHSGRDLTAWSAQWLQTAGHNTLRAEYTVDEDGTFTRFTVVQQAPAERPVLRPHRVAIGLHDGHRVGRVEVDVVGERTDVPALVGVPRPSLVLVNDDDLTFATTRLDPHSLATVTAGAHHIQAPMARAQCQQTLWDMVRDAELPARRHQSLALAGLAAETDAGLAHILHRNLITAVDLFVAAAHRRDAAREIAAAARAGLADAPPGDRWRRWAQLLARTAVTDEDLAAVEALLAGDVRAADTLAGDVELRWALFGALVREGRADESRIDAEAARDPGTGALHAAAARAAIPTPEVKAKAWSAVTTTPAPSERTLDAIIGWRGAWAGLGFMQSHQTDLLAPYAERYFDALPDIWGMHPIATAARVVAGLYPRLLDPRVLAGPQVLAATDAYLARPDVPSGLRRLLAEGRADVERSIAAQELDASSSIAARAVTAP